jgi:hypothetical protein
MGSESPDGDALAGRLAHALGALLASTAGDDAIGAKLAVARLKHLAGRIAAAGGKVRVHVDVPRRAKRTATQQEAA